MFIDTSFCIDLLREQKRHRPGPAVKKLESLSGVEICASVFVLCELMAGAWLSVDPARERERVKVLSGMLTIVYPDYSFAVSYGEMEAELRKTGFPIPTMDLLIGVSAKIHNLPLITRDAQHFHRIPGLLLEEY
ncbi:MAG: type II toxin-antitoxin system VapC family toxin [Candidatus Erginobacter occultus]|nr:type II toxin-antitoxin system VapC family toxin [Candidatus Erginobacter occultus]